MSLCFIIQLVNSISFGPGMKRNHKYSSLKYLSAQYALTSDSSLHPQHHSNIHTSTASLLHHKINLILHSAFCRKSKHTPNPNTIITSSHQQMPANPHISNHTYHTDYINNQRQLTIRNLPPNFCNQKVNYAHSSDTQKSVYILDSARAQKIRKKATQKKNDIKEQNEMNGKNKTKIVKPTYSTSRHYRYKSQLQLKKDLSDRKNGGKMKTQYNEEIQKAEVQNQGGTKNKSISRYQQYSEQEVMESGNHTQPSADVDREGDRTARQKFTKNAKISKQSIINKNVLYRSAYLRLRDKSSPGGQEAATVKENNLKIQQPHIGGREGVQKYEQTKQYYYRMRQAQMLRRSLIHNYSTHNHKTNHNNTKPKNMTQQEHKLSKVKPKYSKNTMNPHTDDLCESGNPNTQLKARPQASNQISISGWGPTITIDTW